MKILIYIGEIIKNNQGFLLYGMQIDVIHTAKVLIIRFGVELEGLVQIIYGKVGLSLGMSDATQIVELVEDREGV